MVKKRIDQLDSIRFILIISIFVSHLTFLNDSICGEIYKKYFNNPTLGVDYFFMVSGFGLFISNSANTCESLKDAIRYAYNRISKIYPVYCLSMIMGLIYSMTISIQKNGIFVAIIKNIINSLLCFTLFQSITGMNTFSHAINSVGWFISTLFLCYIAAPLFKKIVLKINISKLFKIIITMTCLLFVSFIACKIDEQKLLGGYINDLWYGSVFVRCWYFILGMEVGELYLTSKLKFGSIYEIGIVIISVLYFVFRNTIIFDKNYIRALDVLNCFFVLLVFSCGHGVMSQILSSKKLVSLGRDTVYIYLLHYPIIMIVDFIFSYFQIYKMIGEIVYVVEILIIIFLLVITIFWAKKHEQKIFEWFTKQLSRYVHKPAK